MTLTLALSGAFLAGLGCAMSPCPLTANLVALGQVCRHLSSRSATIGSALAYIAGRCLAYMLLTLGICHGLVGQARISNFLQTYGSGFLGPVLILAALPFLDLLPAVGFAFLGWSGKLLEKARPGGLLGGFILGFIFALAFCPASAALYFGTMLPLVSKTGNPLVISAVFGLASGFPVAVLGTLLALGCSGASRFISGLQKAGKVMRLLTGFLLLLFGLYLIAINLIMA